MYICPGLSPSCFKNFIICKLFKVLANTINNNKIYKDRLWILFYSITLVSPTNNGGLFRCLRKHLRPAVLHDPKKSLVLKSIAWKLDLKKYCILLEFVIAKNKDFIPLVASRIFLSRYGKDRIRLLAFIILFNLTLYIEISLFSTKFY